MTIYPWVLQHDKQGMTLDGYPNVAAWLEKLSMRPAVIRAYAKGEQIRPSGQTDQDRKNLMGFHSGVPTYLGDSRLLE
jgi:GST-like protein